MKIQGISKAIVLGGAFLAGGGALAYFTSPIFSLEYVAPEYIATTTPEIPSFVVTHISTPEAVKGIYMTACVGGTPSFREKLVKLADETEINAIVIDIKDYSGTISFPTKNPALIENKGKGCMVSDMKEFIGHLHDRGIYVIGRITVFQDPYYTKAYPELAVKKASDGTVWKDYKGISFIDVGAKPFWNYIIALAEESYAIGFDEINFDYIRFPSDGNMKDIAFPWSTSTIAAHPKEGKALVLRDFFSHLSGALSPKHIPMSADLFGMTTTNTDDLNIGQVLEYAAPYFDYIAPMVYPSHYPKGFNGYADVNKYPYEIVNFSMTRAVERLTLASTTPLKLRPWLQDNDYPVHYTPEMVRAQIKATYDVGLTSWMLWDAGNTYTRAALNAEPLTNQ